MTYSLREIKQKLKDASNSFNWELQNISTNPNILKLTNAYTIKEIIEGIDDLELFKDQIDKIRSSVLFTVSGDPLRADSRLISEINTNLNYLKNSIDNLLEALTKVVPDESPDSINIKLPPIDDFDDLSNVSKDLHVALTQVLYLDEINASVKIESVENGSIWLNVFIYSQIAVTVIGRLAWAAAVVYKKILEGRLVEEQIRAYNVKNDSLEDVRESHKRMLNVLIQVEAEYINSESFKNNVPENIERIKNSIKMLAELLDKGAEIHPALTTSEQVSNLFPDMKRLPTIESKIKQITE